MKKLIIFSFILLVFISCKDDKTKKDDKNIVETEKFNDKDYALNENYPVGDVRRYGIFPDSIYPSAHPFSNKTRIETILDLSESQKIEMHFPKGYYNFALIIQGRENVNLIFDDAEFGGMIQVIEKDSTPSKNISLKGRLTTFAGFFSRTSTDININQLIIKSEIDKNIYNLRSKGCQIYAGSKNVKINNLIIEDLGSGTEDFKYTDAALTIEGWNDNPVNVQIKKVYIKSTDRHGVYITGNDHLIDEVVIDRFGVGSSNDMSPMQDADAGEEKEFKALWVNRCYNSFIERITINEKDSKGKYTAYFDEGDLKKPFTIGMFKVINDNPNINILKNDATGVVVEIME